MTPTTRYDPHDDYLVVNNDDPDLVPIKLPLPEPPPLKEIDGFGLDPKDQYFIKDKMSKRLFDLNRRNMPSKDKTQIIMDNRDEWQDEIAFIERQWERRINGYWFFNNGKPTYISGTHYFFLQWWKSDVELEYRSRDRKWFLFAKFCEDDPNCFGFVYPKHRREGATTKAACWNYEFISRSRNVRGGIQSMTETHAKDVFQKHVVQGWRALPFFFQPTTDGTSNPKKELSFYAPATRISSSSGGLREDALDSTIDFGSSEKSFYDGSKLQRYHMDEIGKSEGFDAYERWLVVRRCLAVGANIVGKAIGTSTAGEMVKGGGDNFKIMCENSRYDKRDDNGRTLSGLYRLFIPAYDGMDGFIDKFGNSRIRDAKNFLENERKAAINAQDFKLLSENIRQFPMRYRECFRGDTDHCNFNRKILEDRLDEFSLGPNPHVVVGDFEWKNGVADNLVEFVPRENGKFKVSWRFPSEVEANSFYMQGQLKLPGNATRFSAGADPYKFETTANNRKSEGGGAVFMRHDATIDPPTKDVKEWETNRFVCTYLHRPMEKNIYGEDMIKMCVYYGCELLPEINVPFLWDYFKDRGYAGYLYYMVDPKNNKYKKTPGATTTKSLKEDIYREFQYYIELHGMREVHDDLLHQCLMIRDDMGDFDLFTAAGYALLAARRNMGGMSLQNENKFVNLNEYYRKYSYR